MLKKIGQLITFNGKDPSNAKYRGYLHKITHIGPTGLDTIIIGLLHDNCHNALNMPFNNLPMHEARLYYKTIHTKVYK